MAGYVNYRSGSTNYKIPFCLTSAPTAPALGYYCGAYYYLPLVTGVTTATGSGATCCIGNYTYYAVKPDITVYSGGTKYVANARQYYVAGGTSTETKTDKFTNDYCCPSCAAHQQSVTTTCTCTTTATICAHEGVGSINRYTPQSPTTTCTYTGTYTNGAAPTPTQVASATGIAICRNGIIGDKWRVWGPGYCMNYGASGSTFYACAYNTYWSYNALINPTFYLAFSRCSCNESQINVTLTKSAATCYNICFGWDGTGILGTRGVRCRTENSGCVCSGYWPAAMNWEASIYYRYDTSQICFCTCCSLYLTICYTYGKKYYYTTYKTSGCPNFGALPNNASPSCVAITWACLYCDLCFNK